jgi:hypothetical protein
VSAPPSLQRAARNRTPNVGDPAIPPHDLAHKKKQNEVASTRWRGQEADGFWFCSSQLFILFLFCMLALFHFS